MQVTLKPHNIYRYGHAHAFVADSEEEEGYVVTELKRQIDVVEIAITDKDSYTALLNVEQPTQEERSEVRWEINGKYKAEFDGMTSIRYDCREEKIREVPIRSYVTSNMENGAHVTIVNDVDRDKEHDIEEEKA